MEVLSNEPKFNKNKPFNEMTDQEKNYYLKYLDMRGKPDILKHIKKTLRGKKNQWYHVEFYYRGVFVNAKTFDTHVQRCKAWKKAPDGYECMFTDSSPYSIETQKGLLDWFRLEIMGQIDFQLAERK